MSLPENLLLREPTTPFNIPSYLIHIREILKRKDSVYLQHLFQRHLSLWAAWLYERQQYSKALEFWQEASFNMKDDNRIKWLCQMGSVKCLCQLQRYSEALMILSHYLQTPSKSKTAHFSESKSIKDSNLTLNSDESHDNVKLHSISSQRHHHHYQKGLYLLGDKDIIKMKLIQCHIYKETNQPLSLHKTLTEIYKVERGETSNKLNIPSEQILSLQVYLSEQVTSLKNEADLRIQRKDWESAQFCLETCLKIDPELESCWVMLGDVFLEMKDKKNALTCFEKAIHLFLSGEDCDDKIYLSRLDAKKRICLQV